MRTIFALCALTLVVGAAVTWRAMQLPTHYGTFTGAPTVAVSDLIERPKEFLGKTVAVQGVISDQCKTMGCFFFFRSGKSTLRVDLEEIAMNAPMKNGRRARAEGQMVPYGDGYQLWASAVEFE
jgi:hypothetical protein